ncbi:hypothetical protein ABT095_14490 [Kitasatospora sp. NPDC002227]|uniref:hypothetical protein n=1 Tax=Kitasatospora sp. NPDC002227 TaxID=3154773 RepID=UPI00332E9B33
MGLEVIEVERSQPGVREQGVYVAAAPWGWLEWRDRSNRNHTWRERGGRMWLMDGRSTLAYAERQCSRDDWEAETKTAAGLVEPWLRVLRILAAVPALEEQIAELPQLGNVAADDHDELLYGENDYIVGAIRTLTEAATDEESEQATGAPTGAPALGFPARPGRIDMRKLAGLVAERKSAELRTAQLVALAAADLGAPAPTGWELPRPTWDPMEEGAPLGRHIARNLLAGWAAGRDLRDPLLAWAKATGVTATEMQAVSGIARTTMNRAGK